VKQTVTTTSSTYSQLITFHEATKEAVWYRNMHEIILEQCGLVQDNNPTDIFKDNVACVAQVGARFIKTNWVKHICPQIFGFTQDLIKNG